MKTSQPNNLLFFAARPVLPFGELEGLGWVAKHDLALFFSSLLLRQPPREGLEPPLSVPAQLNPGGTDISSEGGERLGCLCCLIRDSPDGKITWILISRMGRLAVLSYALIVVIKIVVIHRKPKPSRIRYKLQRAEGEGLSYS